MTRKRFIKLMTAAGVKCHEINRANGPVSYNPGKAVNFRNYTLPYGLTYEKVWTDFARAMDGILPNIGK